MTRLELKMIGLLVAFFACGAGVALAIVMAPVPLAGPEPVELDFRVVDEATGEPIGAAFVSIADPSINSAQRASHALSRPDGLARVAHEFDVTGERCAFERTGTFALDFRWLEVNAPGYKALRVPLADVIGQPTGDLKNPCPSPIAVKIGKGKAPLDPLADVAGDFHGPSGQHGGRQLRLSHDGRFAWQGSGLRSQQEEFGWARIEGGRLTLSALARPGHEAFAPVSTTYLIVRWSERLYLVPEDEAGHFCASVLSTTSEGDPTQQHAYIRDGDEEKPVRGLPTLPAWAWIRGAIETKIPGARHVGPFPWRSLQPIVIY